MWGHWLADSGRKRPHETCCREKPSACVCCKASQQKHALAQIVAILSRQLSWSHFVEFVPLEDPLKRDFYAEICRIDR
jgi:hypothetical protein